MAMGSLLDFLLEHPEQVSIDFHLKLWAAQVAEGKEIYICYYFFSIKQMYHC